jgi:hypothetical protein
MHRNLDRYLDLPEWQCVISGDEPGAKSS